MKVRTIPDGVEGIRVTLKRMVALTRQGVRNEMILRLSRAIIQDARVNDKQSEALAIFNWVVQNIQYVKDPVFLEFLIEPSKLLEIKAGDCDDFSMFIGALLESIGTPVRFVAIRTLTSEGFNHVYPEGFINGKWVALDAANAEPIMGKVVPHKSDVLVEYVSLKEEQPGTMEDFAGSMKISAIVLAALITIGALWFFSKKRRHKEDYE